MKNLEIKKIIREMIENENEDALRKELQTRIMDSFRKVAVPFKDKSVEPRVKDIISRLENTIINFKRNNNIE